MLDKPKATGKTGWPSNHTRSYVHASSSLFSSSRIVEPLWEFPSFSGCLLGCRLWGHFLCKWRSMSAILPAKSSLRVSLPFLRKCPCVDYPREFAGASLDAIAVRRWQGSVVSEPYVDPPILAPLLLAGKLRSTNRPCATGPENTRGGSDVHLAIPRPIGSSYLGHCPAIPAGPDCAYGGLPKVIVAKAVISSGNSCNVSSVDVTWADSLRNFRLAAFCELLPMPMT